MSPIDSRSTSVRATLVLSVGFCTGLVAFLVGVNGAGETWTWACIVALPATLMALFGQRGATYVWVTLASVALAALFVLFAAIDYAS